MHLFKQQRVNLARCSGFPRRRIAAAIALARHARSCHGATSNVADEGGVPKEEQNNIVVGLADVGLAIIELTIVGLAIVIYAGIDFVGLTDVGLAVIELAVFGLAVVELAIVGLAVVGYANQRIKRIGHR